MNAQEARDALRRSAQAISVMVEGTPGDLAHWKPDAESWSMTEVVNHLADEEQQDFSLRLRSLLEASAVDWPAIHPQAWATERRYNERELGESLRRFLAARADSLAWMDTLSAPDWTRLKVWPHGKITARDLLASWVAHDLLHLRQLTRLRYLALGGEHDIAYAGEWP